MAVDACSVWPLFKAIQGVKLVFCRCMIVPSRGVGSQDVASWRSAGSHLARVTRLAHLPAAVAAAASHKGRVAAQHDVEDDAQAPQVAALVVDGGLLAERLHHLRGHVLSGAALQG